MKLQFSKAKYGTYLNLTIHNLIRTKLYVSGTGLGWNWNL